MYDLRVKFIVAFFTAITLFTCVACTNNDTNKNTNTVERSNSTEIETEDTETEDTETGILAAVSDDEMLIYEFEYLDDIAIPMHELVITIGDEKTEFKNIYTEGAAKLVEVESYESVYKAKNTGIEEQLIKTYKELVKKTDSAMKFLADNDDDTVASLGKEENDNEYTQYIDLTNNIYNDILYNYLYACHIDNNLEVDDNAIYTYDADDNELKSISEDTKRKFIDFWYSGEWLHLYDNTLTDKEKDELNKKIMSINDELYSQIATVTIQ